MRMHVNMFTLYVCWFMHACVYVHESGLRVPNKCNIVSVRTLVCMCVHVCVYSSSIAVGK